MCLQVANYQKACALVFGPTSHFLSLSLIYHQMNRLPEVRFVRINHLVGTDPQLGGAFVDPEWVFHYIASGRWVFQLMDRVYDVRPGNLVLLPPGLLHIVRPSSKGAREHHVVHFVINGPIPELAAAPFVVVTDRATQRIVERNFKTMLREQKEGLLHSELRIAGLMTELLALTVRQSANIVHPEPARLALWPQIEKALQHLQADYGNPELCVPILARRAGLSESHFRRSFHAITGHSPRDSILQHRIERAQSALLAGQVNCTQIAAQCGFSSVHVFSKTFRRITGHSPLLWRSLAESAL